MGKEKARTVHALTIVISYKSSSQPRRPKLYTRLVMHLPLGNRLVQVHSLDLLLDPFNPSSLLDHSLDLPLGLLPDIQFEVPSHRLHIVPVLLHQEV